MKNKNRVKSTEMHLSILYSTRKCSKQHANLYCCYFLKMYNNFSSVALENLHGMFYPLLLHTVFRHTRKSKGVVTMLHRKQHFLFQSGKLLYIIFVYDP